MKLVAPGIWKYTFGEAEEFTPVKMRKSSVKLEELQKMTKDVEIPFETSDFNFKVSKRGCTIEFPIGSNEKIYGFGLQLKSFNQTGKKKQLRTNADPVADTGDSHAPVPFYVSTKGYGILVDTARYVTYYCGSSVKLKSSSKNQEERKENISDTTEELYGTKDFKEARIMTIDVPVANGIDIYVFAGPDIKSAVQRYNLYSGGGCMPPLWGLGVWYRAYGKANSEEVLGIAEGLRNNHIPCDVFGLEPGWQSQSYSCSYVWDKERYPEADNTIEKLRNMKFNISLWEHAYVHPTSPIYKDLKKYSGDYEVWDGLVPDLSIKEASNIFADYHKKQLVDKGITGFKLDECDSSDYTGGWAFPNCSEFPSGLDGEQMHCMLGVLYQETIYSTFRDSNLRTYGEVRASHALAATLPFVLYSDLYEHKDFIRGVVNAGFSGLLWSPEVRHATGIEDLIRRLQTTVFSPQALVNAWYISSPPWLQYNRQKNLSGEFLENYKEVQEICRKVLEHRMRFIPYLYSSFAKYYFEGIPPFRALVMDYPTDENTYNIDNEYMMGDSILVAPVVEGESSREVYLPEGSWYDFWSNKKYEGGKNYTIEASLEIIPVFIKDGSILPLAEPVEFITKDTCFDITVKVYGDNLEGIKLYEDDGETFDFENGDYNIIEISYTNDKLQVEKSGNYKGTRYKINGYHQVI
jgi:alpha-D-xyloside xylohydrolase